MTRLASPSLFPITAACLLLILRWGIHVSCDVVVCTYIWYCTLYSSSTVLKPIEQGKGQSNHRYYYVIVASLAVCACFQPREGDDSIRHAVLSDYGTKMLLLHATRHTLCVSKNSVLNSAVANIRRLHASPVPDFFFLLCVFLCVRCGAVRCISTWLLHNEKCSLSQ